MAIVGIQLPIQSQSPRFVAPWEQQAGPDELARVAQTADTAGYDYIGVCDHVALPRPAAQAMGTWWMDPISTLGWLAALTTQTKLLTHVFVLPYRHPLIAAKQFASIDHLSKGRLVIGIGAGHVEGEFDALGVDFAGRGPALDEAVPQLAAALENEFVNDLGATPRPTQTPRPPIWIAGSSKPALRRAAQFADGWLPQGPTSAEHIAQLHELFERFGRTAEGFTIGHITRPMYIGTPDFDAGEHTITGTGEQVAEQLLAETPDGVNQIQVRVIARDVAECCGQLEAAANEVLPHLRAR